MTFELQYTDTKSNARAGLITTDHGQIQTPIFMPVGTLGTVKGVHLTVVCGNQTRTGITFSVCIL